MLRKCSSGVFRTGPLTDKGTQVFWELDLLRVKGLRCLMKIRGVLISGKHIFVLYSVNISKKGVDGRYAVYRYTNEIPYMALGRYISKTGEQQ